MPPETLEATQVVESEVGKTDTQVTDSPTQVDSQQQETTTRQVEPSVSEPQTPKPQRRNPSDFYREREKMRKLESTLQSQSQQIAEMHSLIKGLKQPETTAQNKFDWDKFTTNPEEIMVTKREKDEILKEIGSLKEQLTKKEQEQTQSERTKRELEALEMLIPKTNPESDETLDQRIEANQQSVERIIKFFQDSGLYSVWRENPEKAAKLALKLMETKPAPTTIKKSLMAGNGSSGNPSGGANKSSVFDQKMSELRKLNEELSTHPELRNDTEHKKRRNQVVLEVERLAKE